MADTMHTVKGTKMDSMIGSPSMRIMPEFTLSEDDLPEIKDWNIGNKYTVELVVEMVQSRKGESWDRDKKIRSTFKITKVKSLESKKSFDQKYAENMSGAKRA